MKVENFVENACSDISRVFILGNGPSLNKVILENLKDEFTIGVNTILLSAFEPNIL